MSQEVINNDLLTVTSGAVYRALQPKADSTYVNTELNKKANLTYVNTELSKKADKTYVDSELLKKADLTYVNTELGKKITGGNVVQTTGQSTVDVMSQKAYTDLTIGIDQSWVDVTSQRISDATYTNDTYKPICISMYTIQSWSGDKAVSLYIDGILVSRIDSSTATDPSLFSIVPAGSSYRAVINGLTIGSHFFWYELR